MICPCKHQWQAGNNTSCADFCDGASPVVKECSTCIESIVSVDGTWCIRTMPIQVKPWDVCKEWERKGNV